MTGIGTKQGPNAVNIQLAGVGGQGVLLISNIIGWACVKAGLNVLSSEVHGMAQRGGVVLSTVRIGEVYSPMIADGEADALLAFEPIEAARATEVVSKRTVIIVNTSPIVPFTVGTWGQKYPPVEDVIKGLNTVAKKVVALDAEALAKEAGNKVTTNIVMLGALMGREIVPVPLVVMKETIALKVPKKAVDLNLKAFELGYKASKKA